jgi:hypothetical protein
VIDIGAIEWGLATLAVWRATHLAWAEDGPFDLMAKLRRRASGVAARAFDCFYCLSLWLALPFALAMGRDIVSTIVWWLGLSGGACLLERVTTRSHAIVEETPGPAPSNTSKEPTP